MVEKLRIGLIGAGRRGQSHLTTIDELPEYFELAAVCDIDPAAAAAAIRSRQGASAYTDVHEFLDAERYDVVVVVTPADTHHVVAAAVAERGSSMLVESPLGLTRAMMRSMAESVARAGVVVEVGENMWRRPTERLNQLAVDTGLIGKVLRVSSYYESAGHNSCYHSMSLLRRYAGSDVGEVRGFAQTFALGVPAADAGGGYGSDAMDAEMWTQALLWYENGVQGTCTYVDSWITPLRRGHPRFMSIEGTEGFIVTGDGDQNMLRRLDGGVATTYPKLIETTKRGEVSLPLRYYYETSPQVEFQNPFTDRVLTDVGSTGSPSDGFARVDELLSIHRAVVEGAGPAYDMAAAFRDQELSITITESAEQGRTLRPDQLPDETAWERARHEAFRRTWGVGPFDETSVVLRAMGLFRAGS